MEIGAGWLVALAMLAGAGLAAIVLFVALWARTSQAKRASASALADVVKTAFAARQQREEAKRPTVIREAAPRRDGQSEH